MAVYDLKNIKDSLDKAIRLIRDEIALVNKNIKDQVSILHPRIDMIGARQELTNDKLDRVEEKVDALSGDIEQLHMDVRGIRDKEGMAHLNLPLISDVPEI